MPDINLIKEQGGEEIDEKAREEQKTFIAAHKRKRRKDDLMHVGQLGFMIICLIAVTAVVITIGWHYLLPPKYCWLNEEQLKKVQEFLIHGSIGGIILGVFRASFMGRSNED